MRTAIIIPVHKGEQLLEQTIADIRRTITGSYKIYIVSDFDPHISGEDIEKVIGRYKLGEAKNVGALAPMREQREKAEYLYFIDAHMEFPDKGWDEVLISFLDSHPQSIISPKTYITGSPGRTVLSFVWFPPAFSYQARQYPHHTAEVPSLCGCSQFMSREAFKDSGFGYTPFFGIDDYEFTLRMWRFGYDIYSIGDVSVGHEENREKRGTVTGGDATERKASYVMFTRLHYPQVHIEASGEVNKLIAPYMSAYKRAIDEKSQRSVKAFHYQWRYY